MGSVEAGENRGLSSLMPPFLIVRCLVRKAHTSTRFLLKDSHLQAHTPTEWRAVNTEYSYGIFFFFGRLDSVLNTPLQIL